MPSRLTRDFRLAAGCGVLLSLYCAALGFKYGEATELLRTPVSTCESESDTAEPALTFRLASDTSLAHAKVLYPITQGRAPQVTLLYRLKPDSPFAPRGLSKEYTVADVVENDGAAPGIGVVDGTNKTFTTTYAALGDASLSVYVNGLLQSETDDYILNGKTIAFVTAPAAGERITVRYRGEFSQ